MNAIRTKVFGLIFTVFLSLTFFGTAVQAQTPGPPPLVSGGNIGKLNCWGVFGPGNSVTFLFRNYNPEGTNIDIDQIEVFEADGTVLFDSAVSGLPTGGAGILGPLNNVLAGHQTETFNSFSSFPAPAFPTPIQLVVTYNSLARGITLDGRVFFITAGGASGGGECKAP